MTALIVLASVAHCLAAQKYRVRGLLLETDSKNRSIGILLKQNADFVGAARELRRAIQLDPSLERSYLELSALYTKEGKLSEAKNVLDEYLKWNPQSILLRLAKNTLSAGKN